jgi:hypothetical protein
MADHPDPQPCRLEPWLDLAPHLDGFEVISLSLGPDRAAYVLAEKPPIKQDWRSDQLATFVVLRCDEVSIERIVLADQPGNAHYVQPLPGDELLLVCARSAYRAHDDYDLNAQVFGRDGALRRSFCLGDGIASVQTTSDGCIWTSYYDEGVFGNNGWVMPLDSEELVRPLGHSGLVCWDANGKPLYEYSTPEELDGICDCYALNVSSNNETWCYYYTDFPLVRLLDYNIVNWWDCPIRGANRFAVNGNIVLMDGGYDKRDQYHLFELEADGSMRELAAFAFFTPDGAPLAAVRKAFRADQGILLHENRIYRVDLYLQFA